MVCIFSLVSRGRTQLLRAVWHVELSHRDSHIHTCCPGSSPEIDCPEDLKPWVWKVPLGQRAAWVIAREQAGAVRALVQKLLLFISCSLQTSVFANSWGLCVWFCLGLHIPLLLLLPFSLICPISPLLSVIQSLGPVLRLSIFPFLFLSNCRSCLSLKCYDSLAVISVSCLLEVCMSPECNRRMVHHFYYM